MDRSNQNLLRVNCSNVSRPKSAFRLVQRNAMVSLMAYPNATLTPMGSYPCRDSAMSQRASSISFSRFSGSGCSKASSTRRSMPVSHPSVDRIHRSASMSAKRARARAIAFRRMVSLSRHARTKGCCEGVLRRSAWLHLHHLRSTVPGMLQETPLQ